MFFHYSQPMTFNFISANFLSRTLAGTATLVTLLGMIPGLAQASSQQSFDKNNRLLVKNEENVTPADIEQLNRLLGGELLEMEGFAELLKPMAESYYETANSLMEEQDFQGALEQYNQAIEYYPQYAEAYTNRAIAKAQLGDESGAISDLEQAATLFQQQGNNEAYQQIQQALQQAR
jgi:tetratricopeptide (TPR) repeat protein